MLKTKSLINIIYCSILIALLSGCVESEPDDDTIFSAAIEDSEITDFYDKEIVSIVEFKITNKWNEDSESGTVFNYDYTIYYIPTKKGVDILNWTARSVMLQGKEGETGQISLLKKGDVWYSSD